MRFVTFLMLLYTLNCSCWPHYHFHRESYSPSGEPRIRAYSPKGLRVTLDSMRGLASIKFIGTIYRDSKNVPIEGTFLLDTAHQRRRKWVFEDREAVLHVGDVLNYEIFLEGRGGSTYKSYDGNSEIYELLDYEACLMHRCRPSNIPPPITPEPPQKGVATAPTTQKPTAEPVNLHVLELKLKNCQQSVINTTNALLELQSQVLRLETKNELLANILSKSPNAKKITISGVIPQEGSPVDTVNFIIWEKLDIRPHVVSAQRLNATTIIFEVETMEEKLDILEEAEDRLASGRIVIY